MKLKKLFLLASIAILVTSCLSYKKLQYVRTEVDSDKMEYRNERSSKTIKPFDELYIKVLSTDEKTARIFSAESNMSGNSDIHLVSYTVNENGYIYFPFVGKIFVKDLNLEAASERIQSSLSQYLLNTAVRVRFINNNITILGEVKAEGDIVFTNDKLSVFQAIGRAGGITAYGDRKRVTIIRIIDNKVTYNKIDLTDKNVVESPYYYIEPNDVIVVKPLKAIYNTFQNNTYGTLLTTITTALAVYVTIRSLN